MDLRRTRGIAVAVEAAGRPTSLARRLRRLVGLAALALTVYGAASLVGLLARSPFQVAVERATAIGGWEPDQVHFDRGHYGYRFLYSVAWAELLVDTPEGRRPVRIDLRNDPFSGWSVESLSGRSVDPGVRLTSTF